MFRATCYLQCFKCPCRGTSVDSFLPQLEYFVLDISWSDKLCKVVSALFDSHKDQQCLYVLLLVSGKANLLFEHTVYPGLNLLSFCKELQI